MKSKHKIAMFRFICMLLIRIIISVEGSDAYDFVDELKQELDETTRFLENHYGES